MLSQINTTASFVKVRISDKQFVSTMSSVFLLLLVSHDGSGLTLSSQLCTVPVSINAPPPPPTFFSHKYAYVGNIIKTNSIFEFQIMNTIENKFFPPLNEVLKTD